MNFKTEGPEQVGDRGVIHPGHPPIVESFLIAQGAKLHAGTLMKKSGSTGAVPTADQADFVLVQDVDTTDEAKVARCLCHGMVVKDRLIDASGANPVKASDTMIALLSARGIYVFQAFDYSVMA